MCVLRPPVLPCTCMFYSILCSPLDVFVLQYSSQCCPVCVHCAYVCATPEHVYSTCTVDCAVPDHVWSTAACCPSKCLSKSISQEVPRLRALVFFNMLGKITYSHMKNKFCHQEIFSTLSKKTTLRYGKIIMLIYFAVL